MASSSIQPAGNEGRQVARVVGEAQDSAHRMLPIDQIVDLLHVTHAPERIEEYSRVLQRGERLPPISVVSFAGQWFVADGHKRYWAHKLLNHTHIEVEEWTIGRWLLDQLRQLRHKTGQQLALLAQSTIDPEARKGLRRLFWDTVGHWRRIVFSLSKSARESSLSTLSGPELQLMGTRVRHQAAATDHPGAGPADTTQSPARLAAGEGPKIFRRLVEECLHFRWQLLVIISSLAALSGSQLYLTWIAKLWTNGPLVTGDRVLMWQLSKHAALTAGLMMAGLFSSRYQLNSLNQRLVQRLRDQAHRRLLALELSAVRKFQAGELMSRVFNDAGVLSEFVREILRRLIGESMVLAGAITMIFYLNWRLALVAGVMVPAVALLLSWLGTLIRHRSARAQREIGELSGTFSEQLAGLNAIKGYQTETAEHERFHLQNSSYRRQVMRTEWWSALLMTTVWAITAAALLGVVWYGSNQVADHKATPGALLAFCLYAIQTVEPLRRLSEVQSMLQRALAAAARVFEIIDLEPLEKGGAGAAPVSSKGEVRFEQVHFRYRQDKRLLEGFDLRIGGGETVAIVAASGGGKSTIANLLVRFRDPVAGRILIDGVDLRDISLARLRREICVAEQEPFIFRGALIDNVRYGSPDAPETAVDEAIALAGLSSFVGSLAGGLHARLAEGGRDLSGGQKQRIALARAIVRNPMVLVLDEATSALDSETEGQIFAQLGSWLARRTVLVLAHRLSTISRFARVVAMAEGRVIGDGPVEELLQNCAAFTQLFAEQLAPLGQGRRSPPASS